MFIKRDTNGKIVGAYKAQQYPDQEYIEGFTFDDILDKKAVLAAYRFTRQIEGVQVAGFTVQTDLEARTNLIGARIEAKEDEDYTLSWKVGGEFVQLNASQIIAVADAASNHVKKCFQAEETVLAEIDSYDTKEEIITAFDEAYTG